MKLSLKNKLKKLVNKSAKKKAAKMVAAKEAKMQTLNSAIGADVIVFTPTSGNVLNATARPQRPFRLTKAVVEANLSAGAIAAGLAVVVDQIRCGMDQLFSANASIPIGNFRPDSIGNYLKSEFIEPGQEIQIQFRVVGVIPVGESVTVSTGLFGDSKEK